MRPKIIQVNTVAVNGSTGRITEGIGEAAINKGYDSFIAYGRNNSKDSKSTLIKIGSNLAVREHVVETRLFDRHGLASRLATKLFLKQLNEIKPDLVHLHNIHGYYLNYKVLFKYLSSINIPVVWTIHDCWPITGHCVHFTAVGCDKWINGCYECPRLKSYPRSDWFDRSNRNYKDKIESFTLLNNLHIVTVSNWLNSVLTKSFLNRYPISTIYNGIDVSAFYPRLDSVQKIRNKFNLGNKFIILGVATGWSKENGLYDFIELRKRLSDDYIIILVGVTEKLKSLLPQGIIGINRTDSQSELACLYTAADIFINGSFEETFGLVTAEAMACGTPVIVYNSTACPEIVNPGTGFVIPVGDIDKMIDSILIQQNKSINDKIIQSELCTHYVRQNFDKNVKYNEYVDLYDTILKR